MPHHRYDAAAKLFENYPHFTIFLEIPWEVMSVLQISTPNAHLVAYWHIADFQAVRSGSGRKADVMLGGNSD
jgi:hypothetical protein